MMDICLIIQNSIMKNIILFATLAITAIGCAQSKDKKYLKWLKRFQKEYPNTKVAWDIEKTVLKQSLNGKEASVDYDKAIKVSYRN
jgi:hypothetical protein